MMKLDAFEPMGTSRDPLDPNNHFGTLFGKVKGTFGQKSGNSRNLGFFCPKWPTKPRKQIFTEV